MYVIFHAHVGIYEVRIDLLFDMLELIFVHFVVAGVCRIGEFKGLSVGGDSRRLELRETRC